MFLLCMPHALILMPSYHLFVQLPFSERWKLLEDEVIRPRNNEKKLFECEGKCNPIYRYDREPFAVRRSYN